MSKTKQVYIAKQFLEIAEVEYPIFGKIETSDNITYIKAEEDWITKITTTPSSVKIEREINEGIFLQEWNMGSVQGYDYYESEKYVKGFLSK